MSYEQSSIEQAHTNNNLAHEYENQLPTSLIYGSPEMLAAVDRLSLGRMVRLGGAAVGETGQLTIDLSSIDRPLEA